MRYLKILVLVLVFFLTMVFFFQNQKVLSQDMILTLNLFAVPEMKSIPLPFYLLTLASFVLGAILTLAVLVWDKIGLTAKLMKANWRVHAREKDVEKLQAQLSPAEKPRGLGMFRKSAKPEAAPVPAPKEEAKPAEKVNDVLAPDPDKQ